MSANENALSQQWVNYLDLQEDVKPWLQFVPGADSQDSVLQLILDMSCQWVQNYLSRPMGPTRYDRRFDGWSGWNGAYIMLPFSPVLEVVSVTEWWGISGPHVLEEQTPSNQVDGFQCEYLTGMLGRVFPGLVQKPWFPGSRNIEVVWVAGYNPVPGDVKIATLELIKYWVSNTQQASRPFVRGNDSEYDPPETNGLWPAVPNRIVSLLEPYLQVGIG